MDVALASAVRLRKVGNVTAGRVTCLLEVRAKPQSMAAGPHVGWCSPAGVRACGWFVQTRSLVFAQAVGVALCCIISLAKTV